MRLVAVRVTDELLESFAGLRVVAVPSEESDQPEPERLDTVRRSAQHSEGETRRELVIVQALNVGRVDVAGLVPVYKPLYLYGVL